MELRKIEAPTDILCFLKKNELDVDRWHVFGALSSFLQNILPNFFTKDDELIQEHFHLKEPAGKNEQEMIMTIENNKDDVKPDNAYDLIEGVTYNSGVLSFSYEVFMKALRLPIALFYSPCAVIYKPSEVYDGIMARLIQLEDNGDFGEFDRYSSEMLEKFSEIDPDIVAAVTVEQAQCMTYRTYWKKAKDLAKKGFELARHTKFPSLFEARALLTMATVYRKTNKLGSAQRYLELAEQNFNSGWSYEDMAHFYECCGSFQDAFMGRLLHPDQSIQEKGINCFKRMKETASKHSKSRIRDKNNLYALIRSARILLDSNSRFGRNERNVSKNSIAVAQQYIEIIKKELWKSAPRGTQIQIRLVESDLYFRQGRFDEAMILLQECLHEADQFGFTTEGPIIVQRMNEIEQLHSRVLPKTKIGDVVEDEKRVGEHDSDNKSGNGQTSESTDDVFSSQFF